jgi:hypothetical protein
VGTEVVDGLIVLAGRLLPAARDVVRGKRAVAVETGVELVDRPKLRVSIE